MFYKIHNGLVAIPMPLLLKLNPLPSGVTSYGALGHVPSLELVQVVIFTLHVCSVAFPVHVKLVT